MRNKNNKFWPLAIVILIILFELQFYIIEVSFGIIGEMTNNNRDKKGIVWDRTMKRIAAAEELGQLRVQKSLEENLLAEVKLFSDLQNALNIRNEFVIPGDKFVDLYRTLSRQNASALISPFLLLELINNNRISNCLITRIEERVSFSLIDESNEIIFSNEISNRFLENNANTRIVGINEQYKFNNEAERIVPRDIFYKAFNSIDENLRQQIINDPFQLVVWGENLLRAAILEDNNAGYISLIFEIRSGSDIMYREYQARPLAVYYLINELNTLEETLIKR